MSGSDKESTAPPQPGSNAVRERVLFVTSNGTGLGHVTRSMAIARRLRSEVEPLFFTLSEGASVVRDVGFAVEYMASHGSPGAGTDWRWSRRLGLRLRAAIAEAEPRALVFDGILPYDPLVAAIKTVPVTVWCRRGLWRPGASSVPLTRSDRFDAVLVPGEFAAAEDRGPTRVGPGDEHEVAPIVFSDDGELLPRAEAERELGLEPGLTTVLVELGRGAQVGRALERSLRALVRRDGIQVAAMSSATGELHDLAAGIVHLRPTYPMSRYYAAFDAAVSAAGYNAFHQLIRFRVPSLFVPMPRETDDQAARARYAERVGVGVAVDGPNDSELEGRLELLLEPERRRAMASRLDILRPANGAADAARWLEGLVGDAAAGPSRPPPRASSRERRRRSRRSLGSSLRSAVAWITSVPRTLARLGWQLVSLPRPRTLIVALGIEGDDLERGVGEALKGAPDPPDRVLVVTDSVAIGPLRQAGVAVEHLPARGGRQATLAGGEYGAFARRRLGLILAHRPRFRRALGVGEVPDDLLEAATAPARRRARLLH
jgi:UDP:flavonoid glycosyltransferase YjiC (YdhE family)